MDWWQIVLLVLYMMGATIGFAVVRYTGSVNWWDSYVFAISWPFLVVWGIIWGFYEIIKNKGFK